VDERDVVEADECLDGLGCLRPVRAKSCGFIAQIRNFHFASPPFRDR
jgi:hypothetical protein